jgi:hypothetical protein
LSTYTFVNGSTNTSLSTYTFANGSTTPGLSTCKFVAGPTATNLYIHTFASGILDITMLLYNRARGRIPQGTSNVKQQGNALVPGIPQYTVELYSESGTSTPLRANDFKWSEPFSKSKRGVHHGAKPKISAASQTTIRHSPKCKIAA